LPLSTVVWGKVGKSNKVEPYTLAGTPLIYGTDSTFGKYCTVGRIVGTLYIAHCTLYIVYLVARFVGR